MPAEQSYGILSIGLCRRLPIRQLAQSNEANNNSAVSASPLTTLMKITSIIVFAASALLAGDLAAKSSNATSASTDPGWPRQRTNERGSLVYYEPQVDEWTKFKQIDFCMAFSLTLKGGKEIVGILEMEA